MIAYHTQVVGVIGEFVYKDFDFSFEPFEITLESLKHAKYTITCPYGFKSPWEPVTKPVTVICHCPSEYSPHEFTVKATK